MLISTGGILGLMIGSLAGGPLVENGPRKVVLISQLLAMAAGGLGMIMNITALVVSRVLLGFAAGLMNVAYGKMMAWTIPEQLKL